MGGIIDISLDQRILGAANLLDRVEHIFTFPTDYMALKDFKSLCRRAGVAPEDYLGPDYMERVHDDLLELEPEPAPKGFFDWENIHRKRFTQTIYYIVEIGSRVSSEPWKHIALGSDFDGLVDAVNCCSSAEEIPEFRKDILKMMEKQKDDGVYKVPIEPKELIRLIFEVNVLDFYKRVEEFSASGAVD